MRTLKLYIRQISNSEKDNLLAELKGTYRKMRVFFGGKEVRAHLNEKEGYIKILQL